jgi:hypothetical protein
MPRDQHHTILSTDAYAELTDGPVSNVLSFQVLTGTIEVRGTASDGSQPDASLRGARITAPFGEFSTTMEKLFPSGGKTRLWARAIEFQSEAWIDHA